MSDQPWTWINEEEFPSRLGGGDAFLQKVVQRLAKDNWDQRDIFGVRLAAEEALSNAIKHGNGLDPRKRVHVECKLSLARIRIEIRDEGLGFDPTLVADSTAPENLEIPSGRGIMLMHNFMTHVQYNESGNTVVMEKERLDGNDDG